MQSLLCFKFEIISLLVRSGKLWWVCIALLLHREVGIFPLTFKMLGNTQTPRSYPNEPISLHLSMDNTNKLHDKHSGSSLIFQTLFCILIYSSLHAKVYLMFFSPLLRLQFVLHHSPTPLFSFWFAFIYHLRQCLQHNCLFHLIAI